MNVSIDEIASDSRDNYVVDLVVSDTRNPNYSLNLRVPLMSKLWATAYRGLLLRSDSDKIYAADISAGDLIRTQRVGPVLLVRSASIQEKASS